MPSVVGMLIGRRVSRRLSILLTLRMPRPTILLLAIKTRLIIRIATRLLTRSIATVHL